ncbi:hypothetical protein NBRC111894_409 [Sporolactobacillus inulinus]|uniref:Uncharacterized protein n=1 Tax=Sporolactobacillus inulinus TaxID=2078 RepID=A0A4Y1Z758_9BACL|nr:hypothetical protein NBRC111894_409 [Sporolactobacillus inulinus]
MRCRNIGMSSLKEHRAKKSVISLEMAKHGLHKTCNPIERHLSINKISMWMKLVNRLI